MKIDTILESLITVKNHENLDVNDCINWLIEERNKLKIEINKISFNKLNNWNFDKNGNLAHVSGKFFQIEGIRINTNYGNKQTWDQPIINQSEIGFLGIIVQKKNGILHFLLQAKVEPGNINFTQLSPTLQATKSNYSQVHGGNQPKYLEYFNGSSKINLTILSDQLQSEQGSRFLKKRNRNIIIEIFDQIPIYDNYIWVTLGQIKSLLCFDNLVNMDTRTVLSNFINFTKFDHINFNNFEGINFSFFKNEVDTPLYSTDNIISWITDLKCKYDLNLQKISLLDVSNWIIEDNKIYHIDNKYFSVLAVDVTISNREVINWTQPIIESAQEGLIGFIVKIINKVPHFLVQAKVECGNFDILELAPTVQCLTGNYRLGSNEYDVNFLKYFIEESQNVKTLHKSLQSEEGGRFYREQNLNIIIQVDENFADNKIPENFIWMTYPQLMDFIKFNNYLNIQARSLLSCLSFK